MSVGSTIGRALGPIESVIDVIDRARSLNFVVIAELVGPLSEDALRSALDRAQRRHPLLGVCIVRRGADASFSSVGVRAIPLERVDGGDVHALAEREMNVPLPRERGPLVRCTWIRESGEPQRSTLMLTFNHVIGDGTSGALLMRDVVALAGGGVEGPPLPMPAPLEAHLPPWTRGPKGLWRLLRFIAREVLGYVRHRGLPRRVRHEARVKLEQVVARFVERTVRGAPLDRLVARCRREGTSVHGALSAALMQAYLLCEEGNRARVLCLGSPVNMRDRMEPPVGEDVGLFVSMAQSTHRVRAGTAFWDLARAARSELVTCIRREDPFCFVPVVGWLVPRLSWWLGGPDAPRKVAALAARLVNATTGITNLGVLSVGHRHGALTIERIHFVVSPSAMADFMTTAATFDGVLSWNFVHNAPRVGTQRVEALASAAVEVLERACGE